MPAYTRMPHHRWQGGGLERQRSAALPPALASEYIGRAYCEARASRASSSGRTFRLPGAVRPAALPRGASGGVRRRLPPGSLAQSVLYGRRRRSPRAMISSLLCSLACALQPCASAPPPARAPLLPICAWRFGRAPLAAPQSASATPPLPSLTPRLRVHLGLPACAHVRDCWRQRQATTAARFQCGSRSCGAHAPLAWLCRALLGAPCVQVRPQSGCAISTAVTVGSVAMATAACRATASTTYA